MVIRNLAAFLGDVGHALVAKLTTSLGELTPEDDARLTWCSYEWTGRLTGEQHACDLVPNHPPTQPHLCGCGRTTPVLNNEQLDTLGAWLTRPTRKANP